MIARYPALYRDAHGEETTVIENDSKTLRMTVRDVEFTGAEFDDFEPSIVQDDPALALFTLYHDSLCSYVLECDIPLPVTFGDETLDGLLHMRLNLGDPRQSTTGPVIGAIDREELLLTLTVAGQTFRSCGKHGWFDDELLEIEAAPPDGMYLRCCHYCACANYGPVGFGLFGGLYCFKDTRKHHLFRNKADLFHGIVKEHAPAVQETYQCPEFMNRKLGIAHKP
jgi:hypothetical protein